MLRILPIFVAMACLGGCANASSGSAPDAIERSACARDTICTISGGRREVAGFDNFHDGKHSPLLRARVETIAQRTCALESKGMQVLGMWLEDVIIARRPTWSIMHLQFSCSGPIAISPGVAETMVVQDMARRRAEDAAAQAVQKRQFDQRVATDPVYQRNIAEGLTQDLVRYRFVVTFKSLGNGPDPAAAALFQTILAEQENAYGYDFNDKKVWWGNPGEYAMCYMLDELDVQQQREFIAAFTSRLRTSRASISENSQCTQAWYRAIRG